MKFQNPLCQIGTSVYKQFLERVIHITGHYTCNDICLPSQSDGQSEALNKCLEMYLRCLTFQNPKGLFKVLYWAEYWYNTAFHKSLCMTPFKPVYGRDPSTLLRQADSLRNTQWLNINYKTEI